MSVEFKDYYQILGVSRNATAEEIKKAFRKLARECHPDFARDNPEAERRFKDINEAHEVLIDPVKREKYDRLGARWRDFEETGSSGAHNGGHTGGAFRPQGGADGFEFDGSTGFSDFFERFFGTRGDRNPFAEIFGERGGHFTGRRDSFGRAPVPGGDTEADLMVTLEEALRGSSRDLLVRRPDPATGRETTQTVRVSIPAGVREGQSIRVRGLGESGTGGAASGNLYLRVRLAAHPDFRVEGNDLVHDLTLAPWEAVLGTGVEVPVPGGYRVRVKVPRGTRAGRRLRVPGRGLPLPGGGWGDLLMAVRIDVPEYSSKRERELWRELSKISEFRPRGEAGEAGSG